MDFYLGVVMATIIEKYGFYAVMEGFTEQQIRSKVYLLESSIFQLIPRLKRILKNKLDYRLTKCLKRKARKESFFELTKKRIDVIKESTKWSFICY